MVTVTIDGVELQAHESRDARRIALRGGQRFDAACEGLGPGRIGASEQAARGGVEHGDVLPDVARLPGGEVHDLV